LKEVLSVFPPATVKKIPGEGPPDVVYKLVSKKVEVTLKERKAYSRKFVGVYACWCVSFSYISFLLLLLLLHAGG